jgi:hypothetical protein
MFTLPPEFVIAVQSLMVLGVCFLPALLGVLFVRSFVLRGPSPSLSPRLRALVVYALFTGLFTTVTFFVWPRVNPDPLWNLSIPLGSALASLLAIALVELVAHLLSRRRRSSSLL